MITPLIPAAARENAGIIHQHINAPECGDGLFHQGGSASGGADIAPDQRGFAA